MFTNRMLFALVAVLALALPAVAQADNRGNSSQNRGHKVFLSQAKESADLSQVRLPTYRGFDTSGRPVRFIVTDASNRTYAKLFGANFSPKLANAAGTGAATRVDWGLRGPVFPFTPNFAQNQVVIPGAPGAVDCPPGTSPSRIVDDIPVKCTAPAADGANGQNLLTATGANSYSPLIELRTPFGPVVLNAPHIANSTGRQDRIISEFNFGPVGVVNYALTAGLYKGRTVHYITTDSSIPILAALEATTFAPALNRLPGTQTNDSVTNTARSGLAIITNGPTGLGNPQRQGVTSAIVDGAASPLNIIQFTPDDVDAQGRTLYSPMWDIHLATWKPGFTPVRLTDFAGLFTNPGIEPADGVGGLHPVAFWVVNCPIVSTDAPGVFISPPPT